ncbi:MAG TPA: ABC transporter permease [Bryobacteraceae bacterium]|nr:ABC transporter permease [Bryobacteraceae bacterium]
MGSIVNDVRFALRSFRKSPLFTGVAVLSLALGIGANTAVFTLLDQVLLRLLPVKNPRELVLLNMRGFHYGSNWGYNALSYPMYRDFSEHNSVFTGMFCRFGTDISLGFNGQTERTNAELVSGTYFPVLRVGAALGRTFTPDDNRVPGGHPVAVLSYAFWQTRFASDPHVLGKTIVVNGHNFTVVGVAQQGFDGVELGYVPQIFVPVMMRPQLMPLMDEQLDFNNRRTRWVNVFGRLKPGVSREQAQASLQPFFHGMLEMEVKEAAFKDASAEIRTRFLQNVIQVLPGSQGRQYVQEKLAAPLWVLMALTAGVLLIACANVASLLIARATARQKEIAIRLAIGAGRLRIMRQLLVESLLLACTGGVLGMVLAIWTDRLLLAFLPQDQMVSMKLSASPDLRVLLFTMAVSVATAVLFGLAPALRCTQPDVAPTLKDTSGGVVGGGMHVRFRKTLVMLQVTLSLVLLVGAGLFIRSLRNLRDMGPGFPADHLVSFQVDPSLDGYTSARTKIFYRQLTDTLASIPGVHAVGLASVRILEFNEWDNWLTIEGYHPRSGETPDAYMNSISPGYFEALGVPVLAGRAFNLQDTGTVQHGPKPTDLSPRVVVVNEKFAKKFFGSAGNAIGRHVGFGIDPNTKTDMEIVGVVKDIKYTSLRDEIPIQMFIPYLANDFVAGMTVYFRTSVDPAQVAAAARSKVRDLDSNLPLYGFRTVDQQVSNSLVIERLIATLSAVFGALATLLAIIGLYGVMAYTVARRTREIGIRMALGAVEGHVIWMVMREVLVLVLIGVVCGLGVAFALARLVQTQLYGVAGYDPLTLALAAAGLAIVACAAGYLPALRASRVDAMNALRYE